MKPFQTIIAGTIKLLNDGTLIVTLDDKETFNEVHRVIIENRQDMFCKTMYQDDDIN